MVLHVGLEPRAEPRCFGGVKRGLYLDLVCGAVLLLDGFVEVGKSFS